MQIAEGTTHQIEQWLADGRCDVGVLSREPSAAVTESWPLFSTPLLLVAAPGSRHTQSPTVAFDALASIDLVIATAHNGGRVRVEEEARRRGMQLRVAFEVDSLFLNKRVVASSGLCMVAAWPAVSVEVLRGELSPSRLVEPELRQTYYLVVGGRR